MKKINLTTGGHKFRVDDLTTMQDGLTEALIDLVKATNIGDVYGPISTTAFRLWGASFREDYPTSFITTVEEGAIYWNGVIYPVAADVVLQTTPNAYWVIQQELLPPTALPNENIPTATGVKYQDGTFQNVHVKETLAIEYHASPPVNGILASSVLRSPLRLAIEDTKAKFDLAESNWTDYRTFVQLQPYNGNTGLNVGAPISSNSTITTASVNLTGESCYFRVKRIGKTVHCNFLLEITIPGSTAAFSELRFDLTTVLSSVTTLFPVSGTYYSNTSIPSSLADGLNPVFISSGGIMSFKKYIQVLNSVPDGTWRDSGVYINDDVYGGTGLMIPSFKTTMSGNLTFEINL